MFFLGKRNKKISRQSLTFNYDNTVSANIDNKPYELDMLYHVHNNNVIRDVEMTVINRNKENKEEYKKQKIKSLKLTNPIYKTRWSEDIFEQINLDNQKRRISELKIIEPTYKSNWLE